MRRSPRAWLLAGLCLWPGCAHYSTSSGLLGGIHNVAVPVAENETAEAEIEEVLTQRISDRFTADGRLKVVGEEGADAVLHLKITSLEDRPFTYTAKEETEQYRFWLLVDAALVDIESGRSLLKLEAMEGWGTYDANLGDEEKGGRDEAIGAALDMVIEEIVDRTTASW